MYASNLGQVVDIVVSHQGVATKSALVSQLMSALVLPAPEHYRPLLRRLAALGARPWLNGACLYAKDVLTPVPVCCPCCPGRSRQRLLAETPGAVNSLLCAC